MIANNNKMITDEAYLKFKDEILADTQEGLKKVHEYLQNKYSLYIDSESISAECLLFLPDEIFKQYIENLKEQSKSLMIRVLNTGNSRKYTIEISALKNFLNILASLWKDNISFVSTKLFDIELINTSQELSANPNKRYTILLKGVSRNPAYSNSIFFQNFLFSFIQSLVVNYLSQQTIHNFRILRNNLNTALEKMISFKDQEYSIDLQKVFPDININMPPYSWINVTDGELQKHIRLTSRLIEFEIGLYNIKVNTPRLVSKFKKYLEQNLQYAGSKKERENFINKQASYLKYLYMGFRRNFAKSFTSEIRLKRARILNSISNETKMPSNNDYTAYIIKGEGSDTINICYNPLADKINYLSNKYLSTKNKIQFTFKEFETMAKCFNNFKSSDVLYNLYMHKIVILYLLYKDNSIFIPSIKRFFSSNNNKQTGLTR